MGDARSSVKSKGDRLSGKVELLLPVRLSGSPSGCGTPTAISFYRIGEFISFVVVLDGCVGLTGGNEIVVFSGREIT